MKYTVQTSQKGFLTYTLNSSDFINAPSVIGWARNKALSGQIAYGIAVIRRTFSLSHQIAELLCEPVVAFAIKDDTIILEVDTVTALSHLHYAEEHRILNKLRCYDPKDDKSTTYASIYRLATLNRPAAFAVCKQISKVYSEPALLEEFTERFPTQKPMPAEIGLVKIPYVFTGSIDNSARPVIATRAAITLLSAALNLRRAYKNDFVLQNKIMSIFQQHTPMLYAQSKAFNDSANSLYNEGYIPSLEYVTDFADYSTSTQKFHISHNTRQPCSSLIE